MRVEKTEMRIRVCINVLCVKPPDSEALRNFVKLLYRMDFVKPLGLHIHIQTQYARSGSFPTGMGVPHAAPRGFAKFL